MRAFKRCLSPRALISDPIVSRGAPPKGLLHRSTRLAAMAMKRGKSLDLRDTGSGN
jgi:hypothetical protein